MALKVHTKELVEAPPDEETIYQKVDRLGAVAEELVQLNAKAKKTELSKKIVALGEENAKLADEIRTAAEKGLDPEETVSLAGALYKATFGVVPKKRILEHPELVFDMLTKLELLKIVSFKLADLDDYLTKPQREKVLKEIREGKRRLKVEAK